jgi:glucose-6-phosphate 1-dehydrogenase
MREACDKFARRRPVEDSLWTSFSEGLFYSAGTFEDPATYARLKALLDKLDEERGTGGNRVFYLSTPPSEYPTIVAALGKAGLINRERSGPFTRVIIEKPFGHDLASARALNRTVHEVLREEQTYRIDHYLGKETVQNILVFRFANGIWEPLWDQKYVDHVQLTVAEAIGVEGRGGYFEQSGILRDMVQNRESCAIWCKTICFSFYV